MKIIVINEFAIGGKTYIPQDNSYARDITNDCDTTAVYNVPLIIVSLPYKKQVHTGWWLTEFGEKYLMMIQAMDINTGYIYEVMYCPAWIQD